MEWMLVRGCVGGLNFLGGGENCGKIRKAIELGTTNNDESLPQFQKHLERVTTEAKAATKN